MCLSLSDIYFSKKRKEAQMGQYPSSQCHSSFSKLFLEKIPKTGVPTKEVDEKWLLAQGFTGANDKGLLSILKFLGLVDSKKEPTDAWTKVRNNMQQELAGILLEKYGDLFSMYPTAPSVSADDLENFFRQTTTKSIVTVKRMVKNFQTLAVIANLNSRVNGSEVEEEREASPSVNTQSLATADPSVSRPLGSYQSQGLTVNLNIQLTLPESTNADLLEQLFSSMHKHLLPND